MEYKHLFSPIRLGSLTLENRIISSAIHLMYAGEDRVEPRLIEYYRRRAGSGVGLMIVGGCAVDTVGHSEHMISLAREEGEEGFVRLTQAVHEEGGRIAAQLYHSGRYAHSDNNGGAQAVAPSPIPSLYTGQVPREMTLEDIRHVVGCFADAALRAKRVGFDAVEIIGSAGYLICQFLSPLTNHRKDAYGGCFENRARFGCEVVSAVREAVGPGYPVQIRLSGNSFMQDGGDGQTTAEFAQLLERAGVSSIHVTGGWHETLVPQVSGEVPPGAFSYLAAQVRQAVSVPVAASNRINGPEVAERILATGAADLVNMGRALLADPDFVKKLREGRQTQMRRCIACNQGCMDRCFSGKDVACAVNPFSGREKELQIRPAEEPKRILVVGAGPAGMEFAAYAKRRGHQVELWEKSVRLGGQVRAAAQPPGKHDFRWLIRQQEAVLEDLGVPVILEREATLPRILEYRPDAVVLAHGALPRPVPFPVEPGAEVVRAEQILLGEVTAGRRVAVIGGGAVGCETALYLAEEATPSAETIRFLLAHRAEPPETVCELIDRPTREITVVEFAGRIGNGIGKSTRWAVKKNLERLQVRTMTNTQALRALPGRLQVRSRPDGPVRELPVDTVVLAVGSVPPEELWRGLEGRLPVYRIGDAVEARTIGDALSEAVQLALRI